MAIKVDLTYWRDENGKIVLGDTSIVPCAPDDPFRLRTAEELDQEAKSEEKKPT